MNECVSCVGHFKILSKDNALPLVAFSLTPTTNKEGKEEHRQYNEFDIADKLRQRGWVLPAYTMAPDARYPPSCPPPPRLLECAALWSTLRLATLLDADLQRGHGQHFLVAFVHHVLCRCWKSLEWPGILHPGCILDAC